MLKPVDNYFLQQPEPEKSCLLALRTLLLSVDKDITEVWKYGMPFYCYHGRMFCYLWTHKKLGQPYLGIVEGAKIEHPLLLKEKRTRMKIMLVDPAKDIPAASIKGILKKALRFYR